MKISLEYSENKELEVIIKGNTNSEEAAGIISALNNISIFGKIMLRKEDENFLYDPKDIFYFESVKLMPSRQTKDMKQKKSFMNYAKH